MQCSGKKLWVSGGCPHCPHQDFIRDTIHNHTGVLDCTVLYHIVLPRRRKLLTRKLDQWSNSFVYAFTKSQLGTPAAFILCPSNLHLFFLFWKFRPKLERQRIERCGISFDQKVLPRSRWDSGSPLPSERKNYIDAKVNLRDDSSFGGLHLSFFVPHQSPHLLPTFLVLAMHRKGTIRPVRNHSKDIATFCRFHRYSNDL